MKNTLLFLLFICSFLGFSQKQHSNIRHKKVVVKDSITIDSVSINPFRFVVKTKDNKVIDSTLYTVDFAKALLRFKQPIEIDTIKIEYLRYPNFLTKVYKQLDDKVIVNRSSTELQQLYKLENSNKQNTFTPFDGLTTSGSISRGVTIGNNQNSVLNSELDLQISGKLSDKVSLRASIQDANIPLQESGYSQRLDEFDQVFIELFSDDWNIRAGDIDLVNTNSYFANFSKRVQGLSVNAKLSEKMSVFASGALVRGQFTTTQFTAQEGNQGPYKLRGPNNELFVLIVSGSETVYVNGVPLERGENNDYIIDYNAGEIIFNSTFPITSEMRITIDYQFSERNYSRFTIFGGGSYNTEKLNLNVSVYSESDAKNQPLQQNLSTEQTQILADAGDDTSLMVAPSATAESYSENRILYRKEILGAEEIFVFSQNPEDDLFSVRFTLVGTNQGNYVLSNDNAVSNIFEYVAPIAGVPQGNYEPITQLVAPERLQIAVLNGRYKPTEKTNLFFELAGSKNDANLFSNIDDDDNDGFAGKLTLKQNLIKSDSLWNLSALVDADFIQENFRTIQRLYRAEFNRDWNLDTQQTNQMNLNFGDQLLLTSGLQLSHLKKGTATYNFEHLNYSEDFNGNRHNVSTNLRLGNFSIFSNSSFLDSKSTINRSTFLRSFNRLVYGKNNKWAGVKFTTEDNEQRAIATDSLTPLSQKFKAYEAFVGIGDSTKVFTEVGYIKRFNDSLRANTIKRVNSSNTYYLKSRLIQNKNTNLQLFVNYRDLKSEDETLQDEQSLNSRLSYNQKLFNNLILWNTNFETNSGTLPQQDFTYVEVEAGQGAYTWIDYNENSIQELNEFEIAQFADQGNYIRVLLPNQIFVRTHQNRLSQTLTINPQQWSTSENKTKKFFSHFYNQTSYLIDRKIKREGNNFNLNPFNDDEENQLALNNSVRNVLFFNRGKQGYTTSYTFLTNTSRNLLSIGFQENKLTNHQLNFNHKFAVNWLANALASFGSDKSLSENFANRNYNIDETRFQPKLSYLFNENAQFDVFYQFTSKENTIDSLESLTQNNYGVSFTYNNAQKIALTGEFNFFENTYEGNPNTPVAYQMLEGLQPGKNFTWSLLAQKKLTKFLDLNLNYFGRKTETSKTIHTGTVQLKAYF
ncbi:hypothetical protein H8K90_03980 [Winogradskyella echinorum]|uniref:Outer membrane protein beta-barrel family protein n=1 Tax=Winogradskyella echinorum TaxID=538189 RepID=A0ABR6XYH5_9FLAO|nr:hypothetical protein [Winogradskyella echinorum]MBC3845531.1 hypothetical protein [Winogradskyella echinorum]MBC5749879.1 hypothetical protein [Winogradskyella echinorum]